MKVIEIKKIIEKTLNDNKANDVAVIDLKKKSYIADYMIIASGTSSRHLQALSEILVSELTVLFHNYGFRHLLAVDENNQPQGVVSLSDVIKSQGLEHYFHYRQVDKSYNAKIPDEYGNSQIVKAIIALAQSLDLEMVAEGVEKEKQLQFLQSIGCHVIQVDFYSKALPKNEFNHFTANQKLDKFTSSKLLEKPFKRTISRLYELTSID